MAAGYREVWNKFQYPEKGGCMPPLEKRQLRDQVDSFGMEAYKFLIYFIYLFIFYFSYYCFQFCFYCFDVLEYFCFVSVLVLNTLF